MAFFRTFQLAFVVAGVLAGILPTNCDKNEGRARGTIIDSGYKYPVQETNMKKIFEYIREKLVDNQVGARTFHQIKKFQSALLPIMYKLGVISTIIMITLFLAMKGVFIGTLILILNVAFLAAKFGGLWKGEHQHHGGWAPTSQGLLQKDVHLHIHSGQNKPQYIPYGPSYSAPTSWEPTETAWSQYGPHHSGRQLTNAEYTTTDKVDTSSKPFEIIYPSESKQVNQVLLPYNYVKHYQPPTKT